MLRFENTRYRMVLVYSLKFLLHWNKLCFFSRYIFFNLDIMTDIDYEETD